MKVGTTRCSSYECINELTLNEKTVSVFQIMEELEIIKKEAAIEM